MPPDPDSKPDTPTSLDSGLRGAIAEAIAEKFTSEYGARNPGWDIDKPDGPDNPYHFTRPMAERVESGPMVIFDAGDGCRSMRVPSCLEIADVVVDLLRGDLSA